MKESYLRFILYLSFIFGISHLSIHSKPTHSKWKKNEKPIKQQVDKSTKRVMRILIFIDRFPWYTKQVIVNQIIGLLDRGHDVYIYSKVKMEKYKMNSTLEKYLTNRIYYEKLPSDLSSYDIIIFQYGNLAEEFYTLRKKHKIKAKLVTFFRGSDVTCPRKNHQYAKLFEEGDLFLPICEYYKFRLILLGCDPKKMAVQYSGVNCSQFTFKKRFFSRKDINITSIGRLIERKGFPYLISSIAHLLKEYPNINYTIVGDGPERDNIEKQVKKLGIANKVKLLGWKTQDKIKKILYNSHIFLAPSVTTRKGGQDAPVNVLKEAMLTGLPVVASYHGGIIELVDKSTGLLVPERDVPALVESVKYLLKNQKQCITLGEAGRKKVKELFDMEKLNDRLEKILLDLLGVKL